MLRSAARQLDPSNRKCVTLVRDGDAWVWLPDFGVWYLYDGALESDTRTMSEMVGSGPPRAAGPTSTSRPRTPSPFR